MKRNYLFYSKILTRKNKKNDDDPERFITGRMYFFVSDYEDSVVAFAANVEYNTYNFTVGISDILRSYSPFVCAKKFVQLGWGWLKSGRKRIDIK